VNHLERIVAATRKEVARRRTPASTRELYEAGRARLHAGQVRPFEEALSGPGLALIAEHKRRSPSAGGIRDGLTVGEVVGAYERAGAAALSILTEGPNFGGSLDDLRLARIISGLPILRKDFIVDRYQLHEARAGGADAVLLIVAALDRQELRDLHLFAKCVGLAVLVEIHDERELEAALEIEARLIGINSRDLGTLEVDTGRAFELRTRVPDGVVTVAESGFSKRAQLDELQDAGFNAVLVGESLMRSPDIEAACRSLIKR
jgi:indole-3-glycerol phosphate synthase